MTNLEFENLTINLANHILTNNSTIRATAKVFNIPKSTVHHILCTNLRHIDYSLYLKVRKQEK